MPIYEYRCECGATLESLESVGSKRALCGELCQKQARAASGDSLPPVGQGRLERLLSAPGIRGDGHEAKEPVFDPVKRANRPGCDDCSCDN
jgi:hypothetical protein